MKQNIDAIIFDIDGVLIGNESFTQATCRTVTSFLPDSKKMDDTALSKAISALKSIPGFNNDWDTSFALIELFLLGISPSAFPQRIRPLTETIRNTTKYKRVKRRFQSIYLGTNYDGCIADETLRIDRGLLSDLQKEYCLGIATGRPRNEAIFALTRLRITPTYIPKKYIVTLEDTVKGKPSPDPLLEAAKRMKARYPLYVGDTINDAIAAKRAGMTCIFVGNGNIGDTQIQTINNLKEVL